MTLDGSISVFKQIIRDRPGILEDFEKMTFFSKIFQLLDLLNVFGAIVVITFHRKNVILETLRVA